MKKLNSKVFVFYREKDNKIVGKQPFVVICAKNIHDVHDAIKKFFFLMFWDNVSDVHLQELKENEWRILFKEFDDSGCCDYCDDDSEMDPSDCSVRIISYEPEYLFAETEN